MSAPERHRWWALLPLTLAVLTLGFDITILNVALPTIAADLGAGTAELQWMVNAYVLVFAGLMLPCGALGDRYGHRRSMLAGLALFAAGSLVAAAAHTAGPVIAARAVMGLGAAVLTPIALATLPVLFPDARERAKALSVVIAAMGAGIPLGPLIGGWLLDHYWWGSIFLINVPVAAAALVATALLIPEFRDPDPRPVDVLGAVLATTGLVAAVYGVIEAPTRGWTDPVTVVALAGGAALVAVFVWWQRRTRHPIIDLPLFGEPLFVWGSVAAALASFALLGLLFVVPQYLHLVGGYDAFGTGLRLLPVIGGIVVGAPLGERLAGLCGVRVPVAGGLLLATAGLTLGATTDAATGYALTATWLAATGAGVGAALAPAVDAVLGVLPPERSGSGIAITMTFRYVGGAVGVAVLGSLLAGHHAATPVAAFMDGMTTVLLVSAAVTATGAALTAAALPRRGAPTAIGPART
ncbi:MFS transporter [Rhodococcus opacus]|uniref:MFS transporter n=1 Tax=Rhodococcus opacus TaxID=37919 RepID=UPI0029C13E35|nr:MFS transporter [Rhodococcus opacus]MDX5962055.1 MFS transporter [Rhodococcus opacus]